MLRKIRERMYREEKGFTLIELLVVILIIGILAAIALPAFLGQRAKAQDSGTKSDVRNMISQVESCYATTEDYTECGDGDPALDKGGIDATVTPDGANNYEVSATSASTNVFNFEKTAASQRTCTNNNTKGGCNGGTW
jgi:type IV pilus assembly protein PilA